MAFSVSETQALQAVFGPKDSQANRVFLGIPVVFVSAAVVRAWLREVAIGWEASLGYTVRSVCRESTSRPSGH